MTIEIEAPESNKVQTDTVSQDDFLKVVASFIEQANALNDEHSTELISTAITYAASRFNAFVVAKSCASKENYDADRNKALDYFSGQYEAMFKENYADYVKNYDDFLPSK